MDAEDVSGEVKLQQPPFMTELQLTAGVCPPPTQPFEVQTEAFDSTFHLHLWAPQRRRCESECQIDCISCVRNKNTLPPIPFHVRDVSQVNMCARNFNFDWAEREVFLQSVLIKEWIAVLDFTAAPARFFLLFFLMFVQEAFHPVDYSDDDMILSFIRIKYGTFQCCSSETPQTWVTNVFPPGVPTDILILGQFSFFPLKNQCASWVNKSVNNWRSKSSFYSSQVQSGSLTQLHPLVQIWSLLAP